MSLYTVETSPDGRLSVKIVYNDQEYIFDINNVEEANQVAQQFFDTIDQILADDAAARPIAHDLGGHEHVTNRANHAEHIPNHAEHIPNHAEHVSLSNEQIEILLAEAFNDRDLIYEIHRRDKKLVYIDGDNIKEVTFETFTTDDVQRVIRHITT